MATVEDRVTSVDSCIGLLTAILERQDERIMQNDERLEEVRRDSRQTQRLWVRLCKKYGWLDDEDLKDLEGEG